ncbi:hypothetical protein ACFL4A_04480 [bacterium]
MKNKKTLVVVVVILLIMVIFALKFSNNKPQVGVKRPPIVQLPPKAMMEPSIDARSVTNFPTVLSKPQLNPTKKPMPPLKKEEEK